MNLDFELWRVYCNSDKETIHFCHLNLKAHTCLLLREVAHANRFLTRNIFSLDAVQNYFRYALHYFYKYVIYAFTRLKKDQIARKNKTILKY